MIWRILIKDLTRLRLPVLLVGVLLCALGVLDSWRNDFEAGLAETVLNLLLPLAWGILIALAVQQEPLTSDRAFWLTRPYRRLDLVVAKVLFAAVAVHVPLLVMQAGVVMSHGFSPFTTTLLWKQWIVLCAVTVPSLAIASMTSTIAGFGWCALAGLMTTLLLDAALVGRRFPWIYSEWMPGMLAVLVLAAGGTAIVWLQYQLRTQVIGRVAGAAVAVVVVLTYSFLPRDFTAALQCAADGRPSRNVSIRFQPEAEIETRFGWVPPGREVIVVPVGADGVRAGQWLQADQLSVRLSGRDGRTWAMKRELSPAPGAVLQFGPNGGSGRQHLLPSPGFVAAVSGAPLRVEGRASLRPVEQRSELQLPPVFALRDVAGVGRCASYVGPPTFTYENLKVICESTETIQPMTPVTLFDPQTGREWKQALGDSSRSQILPTITWLSPLQRRQTFLPIVDRVLPGAQDRWLVPREVLTRAQIRITPVIGDGCVTVEYSFEIPDVQKWIVRPQR